MRKTKKMTFSLTMEELIEICKEVVSYGYCPTINRELICNVIKEWFDKNR